MQLNVAAVSTSAIPKSAEPNPARRYLSLLGKSLHGRTSKLSGLRPKVFAGLRIRNFTVAWRFWYLSPLAIAGAELIENSAVAVRAKTSPSRFML